MCIRDSNKDNRWLSDAQGKAVKVVGPLLSRLLAGLHYRVIFMARPLNDVINSQTKLLERLDRSGAAISDRQLAATLKRQIDTAKSELNRYPKVNAMTLDYEVVLCNTEESVAEISRFLGVELNQSAMIEAVDRGMRNEGK